MSDTSTPADELYEKAVILIQQFYVIDVANERVFPLTDENVQKVVAFINTGASTGDDILDAYLSDADTVFSEASDVLTGEFGGVFGKFYRTIAAFLDKVFVAVGVSITRAIKQLSLPFSAPLRREASEGLKNDWSKNIDLLAKAGFIDPEALRKINEILPGDAWGVNLMPIIMFFTILSGSVKVLLNTAGGDFAKTMNGVFTPNAVPMEQLIRLWYLKGIEPEDMAERMGHLGFNDTDTDLIMKGALQLLPPEVLAVLFHRKEITLDEATVGLEKLGFNRERSAQLIETWAAIPGPADILHFYAKEAFEQDIISKYGYDDEFPTEGVQYLEAHGLSREWAEKYWYAHWDTPSIQQGFEMLHRGVIGPAELNDLFKTIEIPPYWRDKLTKIAYKLYTRVDARRMAKDNILQPPAVLENYRGLGYDEEHAQNLTDWTFRENLSGERELTRSQIERALRDGFIEPPDAYQLFVDIGYSEFLAGQFIDYIAFDEEQAQDDERKDIVAEMYIGGKITRDDAQQELNTLGFPAVKVTNLLDRWTLKKEAAQKLPSKSDLDKFIKAGVLSISGYDHYMGLIGYEQDVIDLFINYLSKTNARVAGYVEEGIYTTFGAEPQEPE